MDIVGRAVDPVETGMRELAFDEFGRREEINVATRIKLTDYWSVHAEYRRDLGEKDDLFAGFGLRYEDECFELLTAFERRFTRDRDVEPTTNLIFRIRLKNLG